MFCVWFARLFDPRDSGRQALVLRGPGQTGTSVLINALNVLMGDLSKAEPQTENQFTAPMLAGARLITVSDVADRYYLMQQRFKQRTGGDVVRGELKYGSSGDVVIFSKVIVTTNQRLYLNPLQRWSTSRAIVLDFQGIEKTKIRPKEEVIRNLVEQFPFFLSRARLVNDSYTQVFKSNPVDIPLTYTTMLRMRRGWERNGSILYRWIHTNVEEASGEPRAVLLPGCDGTDDSHYMVENFLSEDELLKPITELLKKVPDAKKEERIINLLHEVKSYISEVFHIEELNESYRAQDGSTVTVVGFPGLKLKADTLEIRKLPPFVFDETLSAAPRAPIYSSPVDGIYLGEYVAGFAPKSKKKGVTKNVLDSIF
jgi:hypothetical protein